MDLHLEKRVKQSQVESVRSRFRLHGAAHLRDGSTGEVSRRSYGEWKSPR